MANNRATVWAREAAIRDAKVVRRVHLDARTVGGKQVAALDERFAPRMGVGMTPPFELRDGEWSVWMVTHNVGAWWKYRGDLHMLSAHRYASWLNATKPFNERGVVIYLARVNKPEGK